MGLRTLRRILISSFFPPLNFYLVKHINFPRDGDALVVRAGGELDNHLGTRPLLCVVQRPEPDGRRFSRNRMMCSLGFSEKVSIPADNLDGILLLPLHRRLLYLPHICFWSPSETSSFYLQFRFDNEKFRQLHNSSRVLEQHIR